MILYNKHSSAHGPYVSSVLFGARPTIGTGTGLSKSAWVFVLVCARWAYGTTRNTLYWGWTLYLCSGQDLSGVLSLLSCNTISLCSDLILERRRSPPCSDPDFCVSGFGSVRVPSWFCLLLIKKVGRPFWPPRY